MARRKASFTHEFDAPPPVVWPHVADTERGNAVAGMPPVRYREAKGEDGRPRLFATYREGLTFAYEERPFTWEYPRWYESDRIFSRGPLRHQHLLVSLEETESGGCRVTWALEIETAPWVVGFVADLILRKTIVPRFHGLMEKIGARLSEASERGEPPSIPCVNRPPDPASAAERARIAEAAAKTRERIASPWLERLEAILAERPPGELRRLRPLALAKAWDASPEEVLDLMLAATAAGLLVLRWDVLCPHCRGDRHNLESLGEVGEDAYCAACDLTFDVDLSRNLEVVFAPHPAVRATEIERFCLAGPGSNAHVFVRRVVPAGASLEVRLDLPPGRYRARVDGAPTYRWLSVAGAGDGEASAGSWALCVDDDLEGPDHEAAAGAPAPLRIENRSAQDRILTVETAEWIRDVLSAGDLVVTQRFRDLFDSQVLAPGITLQVERVVVLFTDLVGSTAMYRRLGDARAFRYVWSHFDALKPVIAEHGGALVKTIGDAVMAVFPEPASALEAAAAFHAVLDAHDREAGFDPPVGLKVGLASGPAYAVNLNGLIDYFGSTVNLAARIQAESAGGDVVVPADLADEVAAVLGEAWHAEPLDVQAKGFDAPVPALRLRPVGEPGRGDASIVPARGLPM